MKIAPHDRVKYMGVGFMIFQEYPIESCRISQGGIEVKCEVKDENDRKDLENYCWQYYQPVWRFELGDDNGNILRNKQK